MFAVCQYGKTGTLRKMGSPFCKRENYNWVTSLNRFFKSGPIVEVVLYCNALPNYPF
jgi:hypothetical protein